MAHDRLVAVSYPVDEQCGRINDEVLTADATVVFLQQLDPADRQQVIRRAEVLIALSLRRELPAGGLADAPALRFIQLLSAGADHIDFSSIPESVAVASNVGAYAAPIAEHVMAMTLALARRLPELHAALAHGEFRHHEMLLTLDGATCAILGYGGIGKATARLMRAFGCRILAVNSSGQTTDPVEFAGTLADLDQVLTAADVLVISLPLTRATRGLIGARELALMKPTAILVNVARGAVVDERALYDHLREQPRFGAGIDTWWHEPRDGQMFRTDYPFFDQPNLIGSPHDSGNVDGVASAAAGLAAANVLRYLRGEPVSGSVSRAEYG